MLDRISCLGRSGQVVACIELNTGFGGGDLEDSTRLRFHDFRGRSKITRFAVHDVAVVVATSSIDRLVDAGSDVFGFREVHARSRDRGQFAGGDRTFVHRQVFIGEQRQLMIEDRSIGGAGQVPVGMVRQIEHRRFSIDRGLIIDRQFVVVIQGIGHHGFERSRIALFPIRAGV